MASLRYCPKDHNSQTPVSEYYPPEICNKCKFYNPAAAANGIICGYYIELAKIKNAAEEEKRRQRFLNDINQLKGLIKEKEQRIQELRIAGKLGKAVKEIEQKSLLIQSLEKKEGLLKKYFS